MLCKTIIWLTGTIGIRHCSSGCLYNVVPMQDNKTSDENHKKTKRYYCTYQDCRKNVLFTIYNCHVHLILGTVRRYGTTVVPASSAVDVPTHES